MGFTDHEHLDDVELIHMNGRVYDYNVGRFMSVDPVIQSPGNSQSINPYSYIMNNPLAGTDPTGYMGCAASRIKDSCDDLGSSLGGNGEADSALKVTVKKEGTTVKVHLNGGTKTQQLAAAQAIISHATGKSTELGSQAGVATSQEHSGGSDPGIPIGQNFTRGEKILEAIDPTMVAATGKDTGINAAGVRSYSITPNPGAALTLVEKAQVAAVLAKGGVKAAEALAKHFMKGKLINARGPSGVGGNGAASEVTSFSGLTSNQAKSILQQGGFDGKKIAPSGYQRFKHSDGSEVMINWETGRVVRTAAPKYGSDGARINKGQRLSSNGAEIPRNTPHDKHPKEYFKP